MKRKKINDIRKKLDVLDTNILNLIKKRTLLVDDVLKTKKYKNQIIDKKRITAILKKIKSTSIKKGIDTKISVYIWKSMIRAFINYEFRKFKKK
jgi:chorismate mutase